MKKQLKMIVNRIVITVLLLLIQIGWFILFLFKLTDYSASIGALFSILSLLMVMYVISKDDNAAYKIAWIILIMTLPLFGGMFYICFGNKKPSKYLRHKMSEQHKHMKKMLPKNEDILKKLKEENPRVASTSVYLTKESDYPIYHNSYTKYYSVGEEMYEDMCNELEKAKHFIFLEYFIIYEGKMWDTILEILVRKAASGVEVRIIYDDIGCLALLPPGYWEYIESLGVNMHCLAFNPFVPFLSLVMNNRDHRKIMVIDGHTAFNGGINLSDEYINIGSKYGHWKDTGLCIKGEAVWNFTLMFLETWRAYRKDEENIEKYKAYDNLTISIEENKCKQGYVQPFCDTPLEDEPIAENLYIDILNQANKYVYIFTPYLVIDYEMKSALCLAAKRGVDVRLVTPGIADKKIVNRLTKSNYVPLLKAGIKIYEYTPGFIHAKSYVCDDKFAVVGTINMDYRSLYLHFECGTFLYNTSSVLQLKNDCLNTFEKSKYVKLSDIKQGFIGSLFDSILRIISPLL